ncbi:MAG: DUF2889 domain-containing protein [Thermodesulfobacteriota bacterium]
MTRLKEIIEGAPVHERKLDFRTYPLDDGRLIVEGWLKDEQHVPGYHWDGTARPERIVHHMGARLLINGWPPVILDVETEMVVIPHESCPTAMGSARDSIGLAITSGFSEEIRRRLGGPNGCAHLTHLITAMGPAAVHGYWTQKSRTPPPMPRSLEELEGLPILVNSCRLWSEDGPILKDIKAKLAARAS